MNAAPCGACRHTHDEHTNFGCRVCACAGWKFAMNTPAAYTVTRDVTPAECPWLAETVPAGAAVWAATRPTYGAIGPGGVAVTFNPAGDYPFFELPTNALIA